jgi:hypothetical protein
MKAKVRVHNTPARRALYGPQRKMVGRCSKPGIYRYRAFMPTIVKTSASVTALATMMGAARSIRPYVSQRNTPAANAKSMPQERSSQRLLRHALCACGTNDSVVNVPAMKPRTVVVCIKSHQRSQPLTWDAALKNATKDSTHRCSRSCRPSLGDSLRGPPRCWPPSFRGRL